MSVLVSAYSFHHRKGRGGKSPHTPQNLVTLCGSGTTGCHGFVHAHPSYSYDHGFMVRRLGLKGPEDVAIIDLVGRRFFLTEDYRRLNVASPGVDG